MCYLNVTNANYPLRHSTQTNINHSPIVFAYSAAANASSAVQTSVVYYTYISGVSVSFSRLRNWPELNQPELAEPTESRHRARSYRRNEI